MSFNQEFDEMLADIGVSPPDAEFPDGSPEAISMDLIGKALACIKAKMIKPITIDGGAHYPMLLTKWQAHELACEIARSDWHEFYHAVRTLRRIRLPDQLRFKRFSQAWWHGYYKRELHSQYPDDGRFTWEYTPLKRRLYWYKLKNKT